MSLASLKFKLQYFTFDRSIIKRNWRNINEGPLKRAGLLVRKIARRSIRRTRYGNYSKPGSPPHSHKPGKNPPFKQIYSVPDYFGNGVVIGMVGYGSRLGPVPVPGLQEHGLSATRTIDTSFKKRVRSQGPKRILSKKQKEAIRQKKLDKGIIRKQRINYKPRPFMAPALAKAAPTLPMLWSASLGGKLA